MILNKTFYDCIAHAGIVSVCSSSADGKGHVANTWNKYLIVTADERILIPCFGFRKTEENVSHDPEIEVIIGSHEVQGKMGLGTGFLLKGRAEFRKDGLLFEQIHDKCSFANRVLIFTPSSCEQTI
jgi:hypothetical protein